MVTSIHAWVDYDEAVIGPAGQRSVQTHTFGTIHFRAYRELFELLGNSRPVIGDIITTAGELDPAGMERWARAHPAPPTVIPAKGLPDRLGYRPERVLLLEGYARPGNALYGKPYRTGDQTVDASSRVYIWPPEQRIDLHDYSWLNARELAVVADRFAALPRIGHARIGDHWRRVVGQGRDDWIVGVARQVAYDQRDDELDALVALMERLNAGAPDRSRLVYWFDN